MSERALPEKLRLYAHRIETALERWLPALDAEPQRLHRAMRYAAMGGGKRVRAMLVYATGEPLELRPAALDGIACAVELVHAYSLVHDDLPAMDNDDLRRGKPSCHRAFDEATAILAGDALQALAFEVLARDRDLAGGPAERLSVVGLLAGAAGYAGMAGGQSIDLTVAGTHPSLAQLEHMHRMKTGALIRTAIMAPVVAAGAGDSPVASKLEGFAESIGLAFQVVDDILDESADTGTLGKRAGADRAGRKPTYTALLGLESASAEVERLHREALAWLDGLRDNASTLRLIANLMVHRRF